MIGKIIILTVLSSVCADRLGTVLLPPAPVANLFHDSRFFQPTTVLAAPAHPQVLRSLAAIIPRDEVQARYTQIGNTAVHEINSGVEHFKFEVPLARNVELAPLSPLTTIIPTRSFAVPSNVLLRAPTFSSTIGSPSLLVPTSPIHGLAQPTVISSAPTNNQYTHRFALSDGTKVAEQGMPYGAGSIAKTGEYEYISPEGLPIKVKWVADQHGFRLLK